MPAPNQGRTPIKLHRVKLQKCRRPNSEKPPRPNAAKLPLNIPSPLLGSPGNRMRKVHGKSVERYSFVAGGIFPSRSGSHLFEIRCRRNTRVAADAAISGNDCRL